MKAKKRRKFGWRNNGWYTPRVCWGDKLSKKQELPSISLPPAMLRPDKRIQYQRIYCDLDDPKYDLFTQYWIRVEKTLGLSTKMTLVAEARKKQAEARVAASAKPYTTAQSLQLRQILMNAASGPLIILRLSWGEDKKAALHGLYPEMMKEPGKLTMYKRLLFSHKDFWLH